MISMSNRITLRNLICRTGKPQAQTVKEAVSEIKYWLSNANMFSQLQILYYVLCGYVAVTGMNVSDV